MDSPTEIEIANPAHKIIYENIYSKLIALQDQKSKFKDQSERTYLDEINKYKNA